MPATMSDYEYYAGLFLSGLPVPVRADLFLLKAADVIAAVAAKCLSRNRSWVKNFTAAVPSLLRFLRLSSAGALMGVWPCSLHLAPIASFAIRGTDS